MISLKCLSTYLFCIDISMHCIKIHFNDDVLLIFVVTIDWKSDTHTPYTPAIYFHSKYSLVIYKPTYLSTYILYFNYFHFLTNFNYCY